MIIMVATFIEIFLCARHRAASFYKSSLLEFSQQPSKVGISPFVPMTQIRLQRGCAAFPMSRLTSNQDLIWIKVCLSPTLTKSGISMQIVII